MTAKHPAVCMGNSLSEILPPLINRGSKQNSNTQKLHQVQILEETNCFFFAVSFGTKAEEKYG